jgi:hypothetical protein
MTGRGSAALLGPPRYEWLPPVLVGASVAVAAEVALAVLLYGGAGFVRSLTTILAAQGIAFGGGLWSAPGDDRDLIDRLRRRWILCLASFLGAAVFGTVWMLVPSLGETRVGQGLGLAILAALPLCAAGAVLGGMSVVAATDAGRRLSGPGPASAVGGALGVVLTGFLLPRAPMPASLLVGCLVLLSLGGMVYGGVLSQRTQVQVLARRPAGGGEIVVEDRIRGDQRVVRELREGDHLRWSRALDADRELAWDLAAWRSVWPDLERPYRVLMLGGGVSQAARAILREHPRATVDVLERSTAVVELGREHFATDLRVGREGRLRVEVGNLDDLVAGLDGPYDLVLVDTNALAPLGGVVGLSMATLDRLRAATIPPGEVRFGPDAPDVRLLERRRET